MSEPASQAVSPATSVFPDAKRKTCVLPVKKAIRKKERVEAGDTAHVVLRTLTTG